MKIWIDILTPKQLLFFEPIAQKLRRKHKVLCTSRRYGEVSKLARIRKVKLDYIGSHGGKNKASKLESSINRMKLLNPKIQKFMPDLTLSFVSPEAARISFGLGIRHIAFCDSPHAKAVMCLTIPLVQKLLTPWIIPKKEFTKYGIDEKNIIHYKAIDAAVTIKSDIKKPQRLPLQNNKKNILIRVEEDQAAYAKSQRIVPIIRQVIKECKDENIIILTRYESQNKRFKKLFGSCAKVISMSYDGRALLEGSDVFIGSGGTMTAESALLGVPTISYNAVPNIIEQYVVKNKLAARETDPKRVARTARKFLASPRKDFSSRAKKILKSMEDPYKKLLPVLK